MRKLILLTFILLFNTQIKAQSWDLNGNAGTTAGTNFIGTTDDVDLIFKRFNDPAGLLSNSNTSFGVRTLFSNTTGVWNTALGYSALYSNTTGSVNSTIGYYSLYSNTTGSYNTAHGVYALEFNTEGNNNTANGYAALNANTTGSNNTAHGYQALYGNTTGSYNTANGYKSLFNNTGVENTANGAYSLVLNTTGIRNTANGVSALNNNKTGNYNTAYGYFALQNNTEGNYNTALGYGANVSAGNLTNATAIGANAGVNASNTIQLGDNNVTKVFAGTGTNAMLIAGGLQITGGTPAPGKVLTSDTNGVATWQTPMTATTGWGLTGNTGTIDGTNFIGTTDNVPFNIRVNNQKSGRIDTKNTFYGYQSGNTTTGDYNTAIGYSALSNNTTGKNNTAIGATAGPNDIAFNNTTAVGYGATTTANNQVRVGNIGVTSIGGIVAWTKVSDGRIKQNIKEEVPGLTFITKLRPVTYYVNTGAMAKLLKTPNDFIAKNTEKQTGFIAQEVEKAAQESGFEFSGIDKPKNQNDLYGLRYEEFTVPLVKAVQELNEKNEKLSEENKELKTAINDLKTEMDNIVQQLTELKGTAINTSKSNGLNDIQSTSSSLKVYPNPNNGTFTLVSNSDLKSANIQLIDMSGHILPVAIQDVDKYSKRIELKNIIAGMYIIKTNLGSKVESTKIIIQ